MAQSTIQKLFYFHGKWCASHPWKRLLVFTTILISIFSFGSQLMRNSLTFNADKENDQMSEYVNTDLTLQTISRFVALIFIYNQFQNIYNFSSTYLVTISSAFVLFSSFTFCSVIFNILNGSFVQLNKGLPIFLLVSDISKASILAQFALSALNQNQINENIAKGMSILGPSIAFDTIIGCLASGMGIVSGVGRVEEICGFVFLSVIVNNLVFILFYPPLLSAITKLLFNHKMENFQFWHSGSLNQVIQLQSRQLPNPIIRSIQMIICVCLALMHLFRQFPVSSDQNQNFDPHKNHANILDKSMASFFSVCSERVIMTCLVCGLAIKFIFFENDNNEDGQAIPLEKEVVSQHSKSRENVESHKVISDEFKSNIENKKMRDIKNESSKVSSSKSFQNDEHKPTNFIIGDDSSDSSEIELVDTEVQTNETCIAWDDSYSSCSQTKQVRDITTLLELYNSEEGINQLNDLEILLLVEKKHIPAYNLESILGNAERGVSIRRKIIETNSGRDGVLTKVPFTHFDYSLVLGACCENVIGYLPLPLGVAGPLLINGKQYFVPMATTEGCLVASTNRGCRAITLSGGADAKVYSEGMTRGPVVHFSSAISAVKALKWLEIEENYESIKSAFDSSSRFARLQRITSRIGGRFLYMRFIASTGDAMGMNMISKGTELALKLLTEKFPEIESYCLSGNVCTDKKPSAVNWINGRGKSVVCEATISRKVVENILKTKPETLVAFNTSKNLIGSAMAGCIGGNNTHASNIVAAVYLATGQDPAQTVGSCNCLTIMETKGPDLHVSCTMPSIEIGTIGGGTVLGPQGSCLDLLGVKGCLQSQPGSNAAELSQIICAAVLAGELSALSALASGDAVQSHMKYNRSDVNLNLASVPSKDS